MTIAASAVLGLLIGSFLTVVTDRVPRGASIMAPGSTCGACGLRLGVLDLMPIVSFAALRGRCRRCRSPIGVDAPLIEVATATLFVLMAIRFDLSWELAAFDVLAAGLVALTAIDLRLRRLPREVTYVTLALGAPLLAAGALARDEPERMLMMVGGAMGALAFMGLLHVISRGGMGEGDVRLSPLLGAFLGWLNPGLVAIGLLFGFLGGSIIGVALMVAGNATRKTAIPFGPFLALGAIVAVFVGQRTIDAILVR